MFNSVALFQARNKENHKLAAAKICEIKGDDDLEDFTIEIDILSECKHKNIVELLEAYFYEGKLWVIFFLISVFVETLKQNVPKLVMYVAKSFISFIKYIL